MSYLFTLSEESFLLFLPAFLLLLFLVVVAPMVVDTFVLSFDLVQLLPGSLEMGGLGQVGVHFEEGLDVVLLLLLQHFVEPLLLLFLVVGLAHDQVHVEARNVLPGLLRARIAVENLLFVVEVFSELFLRALVDAAQQRCRDRDLIQQHVLRHLVTFSMHFLDILLHALEDLFRRSRHVFIVHALLDLWVLGAFAIVGLVLAFKLEVIFPA